MKKFEFNKKFQLQLKTAIQKNIEEKLKDQIIQLSANRKHISELTNKLDQLEERFVNDEISKEQFAKFSSKYNLDIKKLRQESEQFAVTSSNL